MQEPLLQPMQGDDQNQAPDQHLPNLWWSRGGCYPRWWLLAAFFMAIVTVAVVLLWNPVLCPQQGSQLRPLCIIATWPILAQIPLIWLVYGILGFGAFIVGVGAIEVPQREHNHLADVIRASSDFGPLHPLLLLQGGVALCVIVVLWWLDRTTPAVFTLLSILVFLANCSFFQRHSRTRRRYYLLGYGFLAFAGLAVEVLLKHYMQTGIPEGDQPLLASEALMLLIGIGALFWHPRPEEPLTAQQAWDASIDQVVTPFYAFRSLPGVNRIWPNRPIQANNQNNQQNPTQGGWMP